VPGLPALSASSEQKVGGAHTPFTVSLMPFFRGVISKACFFCKLFYNMSKKRRNKK
jgi:hypothetical protein